MNYEKLDNYLEGRKRYTSLQDPKALEQCLNAGTRDFTKQGSEGQNIADKAGLLDIPKNFAGRKTLMPFDVSPQYKDAKSNSAVPFGQKLSTIPKGVKDDKTTPSIFLV